MTVLAGVVILADDSNVGIAVTTTLKENRVKERRIGLLESTSSRCLYQQQSVFIPPVIRVYTTGNPCLYLGKWSDAMPAYVLTYLST